ncbi:Mediator complex subunit 22 family protein [Abortiporus biennis]
MAEVPQSDVSRPSALPTASLLPQSRTFSSSQNQSILEQNSSEYLESIEEEWNKKVDVEIETLVDGMVDIVSLASIGDKDKFRIAQEAFQARCRAESMIRASQSLLSIIHSMKLLLLLSDESQIANRRDQELRFVHSDKENIKAKVAELLDELLSTRIDRGRDSGSETDKDGDQIM